MTAKAAQQRSQPISNTTEEQQKLHTREHHTAKVTREKPPHSENHTEQHTTKAAQQNSTQQSCTVRNATQEKPHNREHLILHS